MNVLLVCDYFPPEKLGGVGEIVRSLYHEYRSLGHSAHVLTTGRGGRSIQGVYRTGPNLIIGVMRNNWRALRLIRRLDIDVVHLHQASTTLFLMLRIIGRLRDVRVIASYQVSYVEEMKQVRSIKVGGLKVRPTFGELAEKYLFGPFHVVLDTVGFQFADVITAVSFDTRRQIVGSYGWPRARQVSVVPNGCNPPPNNEGLDADQQLERLISNKWVVLYLGVFRMRKRLFNILLAVRELLRAEMPVVLLVVGGGRNYERRLTRTCEGLGISEAVITIGPVAHERVNYYFRRADLLCVPSSYEGMPMTILEAMSVGCVVVASDVSGMRDLIQHGQTGFLVPVDDTALLANTMKAVLEDDELRKTVRKAARTEVNDNYSWERIADRYLKLVAE